MLVPDTYGLLDEAISVGVRLGWRHAHKHVDSPGKDDICAHMERDVMNAVLERFRIVDVGAMPED